MEDLTHLKTQNKKSTSNGISIPRIDRLYEGLTSSGADANLRSKIESKNSPSPMIANAKKNLQNIINSVVSLGEEYVWVSDDELKSALNMINAATASASTTVEKQRGENVLYYEEEQVAEASVGSGNNRDEDYGNSNPSYKEIVDDADTTSESEFDENLAKLGVTLCVLPPKNAATVSGNNDQLD